MPGKTHKGALWVYVADDRNSGSQEPPIAWYRATRGRAGESVMTELAGTLQADGFTGYNQLYKGGAIREAACLAICVARYSTHDSQPTDSARRRWPVSGDLRGQFMKRRRNRSGLDVCACTFAAFSIDFPNGKPPCGAISWLHVCPSCQFAE
ncbi:hypothetical protein AJ88_37290 [Mesorhizobium amorphae CCBAU 01583]|nr:hypothetical protein AJ88_37290 [Mesorhizobium amorphae CCBAU 01583]